MRAAGLAVVVAALVAAAPARADAVSDGLKACAPTTLDEAVGCLDRWLPASEKRDLVDPPVSADEIQLPHLGIGMWIRNEWGLWKGGPLRSNLAALGLRHPDDMSAVIVDAFVASQKGVRFNLAGEVARYKAYWDATTPSPDGKSK
jgi:hypothetical protein